MRTNEKAIERMKNEFDYYFSEIDSYDGYLVFYGPYGSRMTFKTWKEVKDWMKYVVID